MSELPTTEIGKSEEWSTQRAASPFRYPGGKGFMTGYLNKRIQSLNNKNGRHFVEPFCGGAGAAVNLLKNGATDILHLNDADLRIFSAWNAMLTEGERFLDAINSVRLDMDEWHFYRGLVTRSEFDSYSFELGFASFYMNRTTRSGIVVNAGPIGGYSQTGKWKIDARFNRDGLSEKIRWLASQKDRIRVSNKDALSFIHKCSKQLDLSSTLFFIDPPYVKVGGRLYLNGMNEAKHITLSDMLTSGRVKHWVLTYDNHPLIRSLYASEDISKIVVNYSLQDKRQENEILVLPA